MVQTQAVTTNHVIKFNTLRPKWSSATEDHFLFTSLRAFISTLHYNDPPHKEVKKDNVLRLCIGLKLDLVEAEDFMASAGYMFFRSIMTDVVIKSCIMNHCYDPYTIDEELQENNTKVLFSLD